jgi:putative membrane protein
MHMNNIAHQNHIHPVNLLAQLVLLLPFMIAIGTYLFAVVLLSRRQKSWPLYRVISWTIGSLTAMCSVSGPLAKLIHLNFAAHMVGHLLLGMLSPLCMVLGAPVKLLMKSLAVIHARNLSKLLRRKIFKIWREPIVTSILNVGGLWILYCTDLFQYMQENLFVYILVHLHVFLAGYLFTASFIYSDPVPHRASFVYRSVVIVLALGCHSILSKYIYTHPPPGVPDGQAQLGSMIMYYGGDAIEVLMLFIFCFDWYKYHRHSPRNNELNLLKKTDFSK